MSIVIDNSLLGPPASGFTYTGSSFSGNNVTYGVRFRSTVATNILAIKFYWDPANPSNFGGQTSITFTFNILQTDGTPKTSGFNVTTGTSAGWYTGTFPSPVAIDPNTDYWACVYTDTSNSYYDSFTYDTSHVPHGFLTGSLEYSGFNICQYHIGTGLSLPDVLFSFPPVFALDILSRDFYNYDNSNINDSVFFPGSILDGVTVSDSVKLSIGLKISDMETLSDVIAFSSGLDYFLPFSEILTLTDNILTNAISTLGLSDSISLVDFFNGFNFASVLSVSDSVSLSDSVRTPFPGLIDFLSLIDSVAYSATVPSQLIRDSILLSDFILTSSIYSKLFSDSISLSELINRTQVSSGTDTVSISDGVSIALTSIFTDLSTSVTDTIEIFDSVQFSNRNPYLADSLFFQEYIGVLLVPTTPNYLRVYLNDLLILSAAVVDVVVDPLFDEATGNFDDQPGNFDTPGVN